MSLAARLRERQPISETARENMKAAQQNRPKQPLLEKECEGCGMVFSSQKIGHTRFAKRRFCCRDCPGYKVELGQRAVRVMTGRIHSTEHKRRISEGVTAVMPRILERKSKTERLRDELNGQKIRLSPDRKAAMQAGRRERDKTWVPPPFSEERRAKIGAANRGRKHGPMSAEHRQKISAALKGITKNDETRERMSAAQRLRGKLRD